MIKLKDIDVIVILANIAAVFVTATYLILYGLSTVALQYADAAGSPEESGIFAFMVFGHIFFIVSIWLIAMIDLYWLVRIYEAWERKQDEDWL
jgi:hypothetical protein